MEVLINYHYTLVELLLFVLAFNIVVPTLLKHKELTFIKWTRIGYFGFWAAWSMALFSGLIVFVFQKATLKPDVWTMIIVSVLLAFMEGFRAIKQRKYWLSGKLGLKFSNIIILIEALLIAFTIFMAIKY